MHTMHARRALPSASIMHRDLGRRVAPTHQIAKARGLKVTGDIDMTWASDALKQYYRPTISRLF